MRYVDWLFVTQVPPACADNGYMTDVAHSGRARKKDNTPLATRPDVLAQIHPDDRDTAARLSAGSPAVVRWFCPEAKHYAPAQIRARLKQGHKCVYCTNKAVLVGFNDVGTKAPELVGEWHPDRNGDKTPRDFTYGSPELVWWKCSKGHAWSATIRQRVGSGTRKGSGCAECKGLRTKVVDEHGRVQVSGGKHLQAAWPQVIDWWHPDNPCDPDQVYEIEDKTLYLFTCPEWHTFAATARTMTTRTHRCHVCTGREVAPGINTIDVTHPEYATEWNTDKNGMPPSRVTWASRQAYHWTCPLEHSYATPVSSRIENGTNCHYCEGRAVLAGFNDFAAVYPQFMHEWDDERAPTTVYKHARRSVNWKCEKGHQWLASVYERMVGGTGCPFCQGKRAVPGVNDITTTHPYIAAQWMTEKNPDVDIRDVTITSGREVWWRVEECGHEWKGQVRYRKSAACAPCERGHAIEGANDVLTLRPVLAAYFDADESPDVRLNECVLGSSRDVNWACPTCHHKWHNQIRHISTYAEPCPRCDGREVTPGVNDAATLHAHLLPEVDEDVQPASVLVGMTPSNGARIGWKCAKGHTWGARLVDRVTYTSGCPDCNAAQWASKGEDEVAMFIESLGFIIERAKRHHDSGTRHNFDIYIAELNVYVEFNGLYYHSEAMGRDRDYHASKLLKVHEQGGTLLTVWEDDWKYKPETVRRLLAHKLGRSDLPKTYARATKTIQLDASTSSAFLRQYHIQGPVGAGLRFALVGRHDEVVAVMLVRVEGSEAIIQRYATAHLVPGGFGKLLTHAKAHLRQHAPQVRHIKTFSDNLISDGNLYAAAGFTNDGQVPPDYTYFRGKGPRIHKFNLRVARFKKDPTLLYEDGLTEKELAVLNKYLRVWDAGKTRWVLRVGE